ncbi:uncharacterized protein LOC112342278 [Selaginella moellendorffii]|uniref:uncharacterized protein LOC112342278 n=1 Tax=Selaginella moellendorffii TaxID=88036 RepID=UPI000D1CE148|nr:uncharacterized protein LOC112342278 [Selaginella moellendorffii]|eukprot:XP_024519608.1 uncharacterized protein LOC112342278 [Selaginella moellendorffii]
MSCLPWLWHAAGVPARLPPLPTPTVTKSGTTRLRLRASPAFPSEGHGDSPVPQLVRLLGLDNPLDKREEAVDELWRQSEGGKESVEEIVSCPGCLDLVVSLVTSGSHAASEAASGLLREVSAVQPYGSLVAQAGAIQEITGLLTRKSPPPEVRDQAANVLLNLAAEPGLREKIANPELLAAVVLMLDSELQGEQNAAAGIIAKLSLSEGIQSLLLGAGVIPKLANILKADFQKVSKVARLEARNALLRLAKNPDAKMATIDQGLMFVPLVGADAYKSLKATGVGAPKVPEQVTLEHPLGSQESPFGAGDLLLGLHISSQQSVDEATQLAMEGRSRLNFLKRVGLVETPAGGDNKPKSEAQSSTVLPWWDAIPRLVLILGLEDVSYAMQGARAIGEVAITEDYRRKLAKAGAVPHLVYLLGSGDETAMGAAATAIEKLSISQKVRRAINAFGAIPALVSVLKTPDVPESLQEKIVGALVRLSQTQEEVEATTVRSGSVARGVLDIVNSEDATYEAKVEAENVLKEIMSLKADPRDKIVDAGGAAPLIRLVASSGSFSLRRKAASVLESLATKEAHAVSMAGAGVDSALKSLLRVETADEDDGSGVSAACSLLGRLLDCENAREKLDCPSYVALLGEFSKLESVPLSIRHKIWECLLKLGEQSRRMH